MDDLDYEHFVEIYKNPKYKGIIKKGVEGSASNMPCGDRITLYLDIDKGGKIRDAKHDGYGCALSVSSADLLCNYIIGKKIKVVCKMDFEDIVKLLKFTPSIGRAGCVAVSIDALHNACKKANKYLE